MHSTTCCVVRQQCCSGVTFSSVQCSATPGNDCFPWVLNFFSVQSAASYPMLLSHVAVLTPPPPQACLAGCWEMDPHWTQTTKRESTAHVWNLPPPTPLYSTGSSGAAAYDTSKASIQQDTCSLAIMRSSNNQLLQRLPEAPLIYCM